jgi:hypothetical protein
MRSQPDTGKGIYIKSNRANYTTNASAQITNILYENITILRPRWWAIWIGPQQQNEPYERRGDACALFYPIVDSCPTQGTVNFENITLRDVTIEDPFWSPGVLLGNETNPMKSVVFENVVAYSTTGSLPTRPFDGYEVQYVEGTCIGTCSPFPEGFEQL